MPEHPRTRKDGYVLEHIIVMEKKLGRPLKKGEVIHHINHNRSDNRPENLKLYSSTPEHIVKEHPREIRYCKCGRRAGRKGLCARHLQQLRKTGRTWDFENKFIKPRRNKLPQEFCRCGKPAIARKLCSKHYQRWRKEKLKH